MPERSLSGFASMTDGLVHAFPSDYDAELDDAFAARPLVRGVRGLYRAGGTARGGLPPVAPRGLIGGDPIGPA